MIDQRDRYRGSLLGLAVGDALGTTVEFKMPGSFKPVETIVGGGLFGLKPGEWTDDTSMALCLAASLVECNGFDPVDQMNRYCSWKNLGYMSSNGTCFDIGSTVNAALGRYEVSGDPFSGSTTPNSAGNGSLMRLSSVPLFYAANPRSAVHYAIESSRTTHGAAEAVSACAYMSGLIVGALQGKTKEELTGGVFSPAAGIWDEFPLSGRVRDIAAGSFKCDRPELSGSGGYVIPSLEVALWAFHHTDNFREGALRAVNVGYDADTYGAIYGQLAGAYYGETGIPEDWRNVIALRDTIEVLSESLLKGSGERDKERANG